VEVFPRMLIPGRIATTHVSALHAQTQVDPMYRPISGTPRSRQAYVA
jgi:hypothetical protein